MWGGDGTLCVAFIILEFPPQDVQTQRILDLEDSVRNLRKLLSSREAEVHELTQELKHLKDLNQSLTEELDRVKERAPSRGSLSEVSVSIQGRGGVGGTD